MLNETSLARRRNSSVAHVAAGHFETDGQGRAVRDMQRGPDYPEGRIISRICLDFSARAGLNVIPCEKYLGSELRSQHISRRSSGYSSPRLASRTVSRQDGNRQSPRKLDQAWAAAYPDRKLPRAQPTAVSGLIV